MSRRDLSLIGMGTKARYDAWPHTRAELLNLRDLAQTEKQLDDVARIADQFDAEDEAWNAAAKVVRRAQGTEPLDQYSAFNFANLVGYVSLAAFEADRKKGIIPPHDGIDGNGFPYWRRATIEKFKGGER
jgi:hypothetical protein